ncbi:MAG: 7-cyano-7-deazaguanine synthase, partial [Candidatus Dadabacteria bacterium]|nr:7-cyano-7-deazaguanine synthase [Candidatus Dadabacteria bacterium]
GKKKSEIIKLGRGMGVPFRHTWSCYKGDDGGPCGTCDSCVLRAKGFKEAGMEDPAVEST